MTLFRHEQSFPHLHDLPGYRLFKKIFVAVSWIVSAKYYLVYQNLAAVAELDRQI